MSRPATALITLVLTGLTVFSAGAVNAAVLTGRPEVANVVSVLNETKRPEGATCRAVREIIIIGGEEAKITRTLCRAAGSTAFTPVS